MKKEMSPTECALYDAFLHTILDVGLANFKSSTLFGRNDVVAAEVKEDIKLAA